jgi:uncharacterized paraquat-inducible protein A
MNGDLTQQIPLLIVLLVWAGLYIWSLSWLYRDADRRVAQRGWLIVLLVAFFAWPVGLLIWFLARPAIRPEQAFSRTKDELIRCRHCGYVSHQHDSKVCENCGSPFFPKETNPAP